MNRSSELHHLPSPWRMRFHDLAAKGKVHFALRASKECESGGTRGKEREGVDCAACNDIS